MSAILANDDRVICLAAIKSEAISAAFGAIEFNTHHVPDVHSDIHQVGSVTITKLSACDRFESLARHTWRHEPRL